MCFRRAEYSRSEDNRISNLLRRLYRDEVPERHQATAKSLQVHGVWGTESGAQRYPRSRHTHLRVAAEGGGAEVKATRCRNVRNYWP